MTTARLNPGIPLLLNGVSKRYGSKTILNELDLHIPTGQFVAVVGRSGGGKSTLLRLLAGLEKPNAGQLLAGSTPLAQIQEDTRMMFQDSRLLPWKTVTDNVGLGLKGQWREAALRRWRVSALKIAPVNGPRRFPAGKSSAWRWLAR
ncbi:alkanesulfonates ABC transporter ATP-binding protein / Sulfonate ABC transporter [Klebsiella michiganensis]|nr:alkanesulfonates ABC transporter ATP-binding protein / Sulfonate ABC transporter [Klebsiella michiganensis]